jgi:hypothetical protein
LRESSRVPALSMIDAMDLRLRPGLAPAARTRGPRREPLPPTLLARMAIADAAPPIRDEPKAPLHALPDEAWSRTSIVVAQEGPAKQWLCRRAALNAALPRPQSPR